MRIETPYYLIDEERMLTALEKVRQLQRLSGAKCVLALKCFSSWCAFEFMRGFLAGTTSSSLYEARLGYEKFGGENHGYSVAYDEAEIRELSRYCNKVIFNSVGQLERFRRHVAGCSLGIRINPEVGHSNYELSNPAGRYSRLGVLIHDLPTDIAERVDGAMIHVNCENDDFVDFSQQLARIEDQLGALFGRLSWLSLGGGISFTDAGYPLEELASLLRDFSTKYALELYLEPGEAAVRDSTSLVVTVLDRVQNEVPTLIVDAGVETHLLDVLTYQFTPELEGGTTIESGADPVQEGQGHVYRVCGRTCLAGDHFGTYRFDVPVLIGDELRFTNVAGYSIVKKNFFNGIKMPAIYHRPRGGEVRLIRRPSYEDFRDSLS